MSHTTWNHPLCTCTVDPDIAGHGQLCRLYRSRDPSAAEEALRAAIKKQAAAAEAVIRADERAKIIGKVLTLLSSSADHTKILAAFGALGERSLASPNKEGA